MDYFDVEDVIMLHDLALQDYEGLPGVDMNKLDAKLALPKTNVFGHERYPSLEEKAACYLYELASGHCFKDGNKRTSFLAAFTFLDINGCQLSVEDEEIYRFVILVVDSETRPAFQEVVQWIARHCHKKVSL
ncbi:MULTISPECIES: type II toxin-antitoxin system death-on-curing family toxin [Sporosarcina]|uniref:type II toxin-antitoxin system death-on-curing family toxin n=1 Tax=Sporosarcina TaxID=1569 RepID=UPI0015CF501F|nr:MULTISPECIES: type II toxin-antitoxin system death-on-curing family toxin [Sporosarcina]WJY27532.1 type II toxin-antitoxin system death-on-curing family toxin [Sporosarcina sp. 0.2-SM1T-5]